MQTSFPRHETVCVYGVTTPCCRLSCICHTGIVAAENEERINNKEILVVKTTKGQCNDKTVRCKFTKQRALY